MRFTDFMTGLRLRLSLIFLLRSPGP